MGTWIEISFADMLSSAAIRRSLQWERVFKYYLIYKFLVMYTVVPCNGNVDWNTREMLKEGEEYRRSLQWERGLKLH